MQNLLSKNRRGNAKYGQNDTNMAINSPKMAKNDITKILAQHTFHKK